MSKVNKIKVKLLTAVVGNALNEQGQFAGHFAFSKGDVMELPEAEANRYIAKGYAVLADIK